LLVPNENSEEIALALMQLLADPGLAAAIGARGEKLVRSRFTTEAMIANLTDVYTKLLAAKERR